MATVTTRKSRPAAARKSRAPMPASLLIELLCEELPPRSLQRLANAFAQGVMTSLKELNFLSEDSALQVFATPRRLALRITRVLTKQADRMVERRGPAVAAGLDGDGKPTPALLGFARSCGVDVKQLTRKAGDKGEYFVYSAKQKGEDLKLHLATCVDSALKKLPAPKFMRWGSSDAQFVRPVHALVMLHGNKVVPGEVLELKSGNKTRGHRFLSRGPLTISHADRYESILEKSGKVVADFTARRARIEKQLRAAAAKVRRDTQVLLAPDEYLDGEGEEVFAAQEILRKSQASLLDEVTALVEWPAVYAGSFDAEFLEVPIPCLALSMQQHQKYFPLVHEKVPTYLLPQFLLVSNMQIASPKHIIHGNERVLRARLSDARFFYQQDRKTALAERAPRLAQVVYHNQLGTQWQRVERLQRLAGAIATDLGADEAQRQRSVRAALLCKADLLTEMVGEFPELQGVMGAYYAEHDGEPIEVVRAIREHYAPRFAGDRLPKGLEARSVALADKLDSLVGIFAVGQAPSGDKDPFGLRRQALGIVRILVESPLALDLKRLLALAADQFPTGRVAPSLHEELYSFFLERLKPYLREQGFQPDEIDAVLSLQPARLDQTVRRLEALKAFRRLPEAEALAAANKRIHNILKQAGGAPSTPLNGHALREDAEKGLMESLNRVSQRVTPLFAAGDFTSALKQLAQLREPVDTFFDKVMVMVDDVELRNSRLALLKQIRDLFLHAADISRLQQ